MVLYFTNTPPIWITSKDRMRRRDEGEMQCWIKSMLKAEVRWKQRRKIQNVLTAAAAASRGITKNVAGAKQQNKSVKYPTAISTPFRLRGRFFCFLEKKLLFFWSMSRFCHATRILCLPKNETQDFVYRLQNRPKCSYFLLNRILRKLCNSMIPGWKTTWPDSASSSCWLNESVGGVPMKGTFHG